MFSNLNVGWICKTWFQDNILVLKYGGPENVHVRSLQILGEGGGFEGKFDV